MSLKVTGSPPLFHRLQILQHSIYVYGFMFTISIIINLLASCLQPQGLPEPDAIMSTLSQWWKLWMNPLLLLRIQISMPVWIHWSRSLLIFPTLHCIVISLNHKRLLRPSHLPQPDTSSLPCHLSHLLMPSHLPQPHTSSLPDHLCQPLTLTHAQSSPSTRHFFIAMSSPSITNTCSWLVIFFTYSHLPQPRHFSLLSHHTIKISLLHIFSCLCYIAIATLLSILHRKEKQSTFHK